MASGIRRILILTASVLASLAAAAPSSASWRSQVDSLYTSAEASFAASDYEEAADLFESAVDLIESNNGAAVGHYFEEMLHRSRFLGGRSHELAEEWEDALAAYLLSIEELAPVADAVRVRLARCLRELGEFQAAVVPLREVIDDDAQTDFDLLAIEELAGTYREASDYDMALQWYRLFLASAGSYDDRARAHLKIGLTYAERGDDGAAAASFATAVNDFPRSRHSHDALEHGRTITRSFTDRYHQGLVLYNLKRYRDAGKYFEYYIKHDCERQFEVEATYFLGRSFQRTGSMRSAAKNYERVISLEGSGEYYELAWSKLGYCLRAAGRVEESLATYDRYLALHPEGETASQIRWEKARLLEEEKRWDEAVAAFRAVDEHHPSSELAADALFRAGLCLFKLERYENAERAFADLVLESDNEALARALYWSGKSRDTAGSMDGVLERYREAGEASIDSYYGRRSLSHIDEPPESSPRDRRSTNAIRSPFLPPVSGRSGKAAWGAELEDFATWLADWYPEVYLPAGRQVLFQRLREEPAFVRADLFLQIHMRGTALRELTEVADAVGADPRMLDILANYCEFHGLHKRAIQLAERLLDLSPAESISEAPVYLRRKICPTHFSYLVEPECRANGIDPNLFYSLMRQESLFEPDAVSSAGARGLAQIMPSTGRALARRLGHRGFKTHHLLDASTNVRFGTYYLSTLLEEFDGDLLRALAGYNGGPDNTERWWDYGGGRDSDVFIEDIGFAETRDYVRRVYLYYRIYRDIYGDLPIGGFEG
jgi:soluble lytic murein transglycosylase